MAEDRGVDIILNPYQIRYVHDKVLRIVNLHDSKLTPSGNVLKAVAKLVLSKGFLTKEKKLVAKDLEKLIRRQDARYKLPEATLPVVKKEPEDYAFEQQVEAIKEHVQRYGDPRIDIPEEGEIREEASAVVGANVKFVKSRAENENDLLIYTDKHQVETVIEIKYDIFAEHSHETLCIIRELIDEMDDVDEFDQDYLRVTFDDFCKRRKQLDIQRLQQCTTAIVIGYPKQLVIRKKGEKGYPDKVTKLRFEDIPTKLTTRSMVERWLRLFRDYKIRNHVEAEGLNLLKKRMDEVCNPEFMKKEKAAKKKAREEEERKKSKF